MAEVIALTEAIYFEHELDHFRFYSSNALENTNRIVELGDRIGLPVYRMVGQVSFRGIEVNHYWAEVPSNGSVYDTTLALFDEEFREDFFGYNYEAQKAQLAVRAQDLSILARVLGEPPEGVRYHGSRLWLDAYLTKHRV